MDTPEQTPKCVQPLLLVHRVEMVIGSSGSPGRASDRPLEGARVPVHEGTSDHKSKIMLNHSTNP